MFHVKQLVFHAPSSRACCQLASQGFRVYAGQEDLCFALRQQGTNLGPVVAVQLRRQVVNQVEAAFARLLLQ